MITASEKGVLMIVRYSRYLLLFGVLASALLASLVVWEVSYRQGIKLAASTGRGDLNFAADRLQSHLRRYRELAVLIANYPTLGDLIASSSSLHEGYDEPEILLNQIVKSVPKALTLDSTRMSSQIITDYITFFVWQKNSMS